MRKIPAAFCVLGLTALALTGCAIPAGYEDCPRPASDASATDLVTVDGAVGAAPDVSIRTPFHVDDVSFDDVSTGEGPAISSQVQLVVFDVTILDGTTGDTIVQTAYDGDLAAATTFQRLTEAVPAFETALSCATGGTRTVVALPPGGIEAETAASLGLGEDDSAVAVVDIQRAYLPRAQGTLVYNDAQGLPTVVRAPDGRPGIIVPDAEPPADLVVQTLIKGAGAEVTGDEAVRAAYTGIVWGAGDVFESTWDSQPASLTLDDGLPGLAQALDGATVGSQLLVVIPPELGYGDQAEGSIPAGSTLVYVIDILGLDPTAQ